MKTNKKFMALDANTQGKLAKLDRDAARETLVNMASKMNKSVHHKIERVKFVDATKQHGPPGEPSRFCVEFELIPNPDLQWSELFEGKLKQYNRTRGSDLEFESEQMKETDKSVWQFSQAGSDEQFVRVYCHSVGEIESLYETLKEIVRQTNGEYPQFVEKLKNEDAQVLAEKNEIQRLKNTLNSEL
jgi:hypothetical protein